MKLARDFGDFLERTVGHYGYLIGTRGQTITPALIQSAYDKFITYRDNIKEYAPQWLVGNPDKDVVNQNTGILEESKNAWKVTDCEGWEECFRMGGDIGNPLSNTELINPDISTGWVYNLAKESGLAHGTMSNIPLDCPLPFAIGYPGHVMFYYLGKIYQAVGHRRGTIVEDYSNYTNKSKSQYWYQMPYYDYEGWFDGGEQMIICKKGDKDSVTGTQNVISMQKGLNKLGIKMINNSGVEYPPDGSYGGATENGVEIFEKKYGLTVDGTQFTDVDNAMMLIKLTELESGISQEEYYELKQQLDAANAEIENLNNQLNIEKQKIIVLTEELKKANNKIVELNNQLLIAKGTIRELLNQIDIITADRDEKLADLKQIANGLKIAEKYEG